MLSTASNDVKIKTIEGCEIIRSYKNDPSAMIESKDSTMIQKETKPLFFFCLSSLFCEVSFQLKEQEFWQNQFKVAFVNFMTLPFLVYTLPWPLHNKPVMVSNTKAKISQNLNSVRDSAYVEERRHVSVTFVF